MSQQQQQLPFGVAEGAFTERKALLWVALQQIDADWHLVRLCEWVFEQTGGGVGEPVRASYEYLANGPWMLQCGVSTARRKVAAAKDNRLLIVEDAFGADGRQAANAFQIDWEGIRGLLGIAANHPRMGAQFEHPGVQIEHPGVQIEHPGAHSEHQTEHPVATQPAALIPDGETPRAPCPRARAPNEPMNNVPTIPKKSEPTPMQRSLVSPVDPGRPTAEPAHASLAVAELVGRLPTPEEYAVRRESLKARIQRTIADPQCHDSLAGRAADLVVLHGVPVSQVDAILDSLVRARRQNAIKKGSAGAYANGAFGRLARRHGIDWGKADDG